MADAKIRIQGDVSGFTDSMQQAERSVDGFSVSLGKVDKNANSLKAAMKTATKQAQDLAFQLSKMSEVELQSDFGQQLQAQFQTAMKAAADLKDQFGDVNQEIKNLASDTTGLDAMKEGVGVLSSGLSGLASVYGLVGGNTEEFAKALVAVNAIQNISNTITGIANALQKQSALMVGLRAAKNAILGTSIAAATAAETANTAALGAETAATGAATAAQWSFNAALAANPIGAVVVAVAALATGIYFLVDALGSTEDAAIATGTALEAFNEQTNTNMNKVAEQINLYNQLKAEYDSCGEKTDEFAKKLINNTDIQRKLGIVVKTVNDVHALFAGNSGTYINACIARGNAMAAEAAKAVLLGQTLAELSTIQAKMMRGEEVNYSDLQKLIKAMGYSAQEADKLISDAGFLKTPDGIFAKDDVTAAGASAADNMAKLVQEAIKGGASKALDDMVSSFMETVNDASAEGINFTELLAENTEKVTKSSKKTNKEAKDGKDTVKEILTSLAGCDAIISRATKEMKNLDSSAADYAEKVQKAKNTILTAKVAKLQLLDKTTIDGLNESRSLIQQIINELPKGSPMIEEYQGKLQDVDEQLLKIYQDMAKNGSTDDLKKVKNAIEQIMNDLPQGHPLIRMYAELWRLVNAELEKNDRLIKDIQEGIQAGSIAKLKSEISKLEADQNKLNPMDPDAARQIEELEIKIAHLKSQLKDAEAQQYHIKVNITGDLDTYIKSLQDQTSWWDEEVNLLVNIIPKQDIVDDIRKQIKDINKKIEDDYIIIAEHPDGSMDYLFDEIDELKKKRKELNNQKFDVLSDSGRGIDYINRQIDAMKANIAHVETELTFPGLDSSRVEELQNELTNYYEQLKELTREKYFITVNTNIDTIQKEIKSMSWETFEGGIDGIKSMYDSISGLVDKLNNAEDGVEAFFAAFDAIFTVVDNINALSDAIQKVIKLTETLKAMRSAIDNTKQEYLASQNPPTNTDGVSPDKQESIALQKSKETEASGAVAQAANQAAGALDNLTGSATKAAGAIGAGASPQPPASEGVDMVSLAGGGADSEFEVTPVVNEGALREQSDKIKEVLSSGAGSGLAEAMKLPEGADKIADTIKEQSAAFAELTSVKEGAAVAQEGLTAAQQIGNVATEAGTVITGANTVATEGQTEATKGQAIANVGEAVSETAKQNAKIGPWGWVAAIAGAAALFATLMSMMKFAEGGIVGGSTTIGDRVVARLNAGEMVLNKNQQSKLFKMINDGTISGSNVNVSGSIRVKGSDLDIALRNYDKTRRTNRN